MKKQGVLPLVFADPADYARVREDDEISLDKILEIATGKPVTAVLHHKDGSEERIALKHSCNAEPIEWFKAGAALNLLRARGS